MEAETVEEPSKRVRKRGKASGPGPAADVEVIARPIRTTRETVSIDMLRPGPQQYRKHFDERKLAELSESIRRLGVQQPIWVREAADNLEFEIIAGERRWRAAKAAGHEVLTIDVKCFEDGSPIDDETALELAIVENNQRADPHPLEECDAFVALRDTYRHSAEQIAAKIRRTPGYVYERLALADLGEKGREAMWAGQIGLAVGHALSRIKHRPTQDLAVKELTRNLEDGSAVTVAFAKAQISRRWMLRIADAPFETADETLVPKAGACGACPKRSGNQGVLFESALGREDVCTDVACWNDKKEASDDKRLAEAKAAGKVILSKAESKKLWPYSGSDSLSSREWIDLNARDYQVTGEKSWRAVLGPKRLADIETAFAQHPKEGLVELAKRAKVIAVLKEVPAATDTAAIKELRKPKSKARKPERAAKDEGPQQWEIDERAMSMATAQLVGEVERDEHGPDRAGEISRAIVLACATELAEVEGLGKVASRRGWGGETPMSTVEELEIFLTRVPEMAMPELRGLLVEFAMQFTFSKLFDPRKRLLAVAEIDPETFKPAARAALEAEYAAEKAAPKAGKKSKRAAAAGDDESEDEGGDDADA